MGNLKSKRKRNPVLFVGMGNRIKSDDGVGIYITEKLQEKGLENIIIAENGIENYIGKINRLKPGTIIMIDAMDMGGMKPGYYKLVPVNEVINTTSNTHNLSIRTISSFLETGDQWVLGIQPENVSFGLELSEIVKSAAGKIIGTLIQSYCSLEVKNLGFGGNIGRLLTCNIKVQ